MTVVCMREVFALRNNMMIQHRSNYIRICMCIISYVVDGLVRIEMKGVASCDKLRVGASNL